MALFGKSTGNAGRGGGWLSGLLGAREIERRVDENFPTWAELADRQASGTAEPEDPAERVDLPPHRVYVSSPLHSNFLYFVLVLLALALGLYSPELAPVLVYVAIGVSLLVALFLVFRDAVFFHMEGIRLQADAALINRHTRGPSSDGDEERGLGFLRALSRKQNKRKVFRSSLLQIHYQNVLRTFEQGNRRTWVSQDASIAELHTLLTQRGMKVVWTMIEVLPQLGLLGTLIGLIRMFSAFRTDVATPELEVLAGFATALGTTVMANIFVLVLRPLYMRNERSMHEVLSTIQTLMAMFILPTQQSVLERTTTQGMLGALGLGRSSLATSGAMVPAPPGAPNDARLQQSLEALSQNLAEFITVQQQMDSGAMAKETAAIAKEVKETLKSFQEANDREQMERQQRSVEQLTQAVEGLAGKLAHMEGGGKAAGAGQGSGSTQRMEHDLTQLRVLTHDTLLLLEQIASRLDPIPARRGKLLSTDQNVRGKIFPKGQEGLTTLEDDRDPTPSGGRGIRLFK